MKHSPIFELMALSALLALLGCNKAIVAPASPAKHVTISNPGPAPRSEVVEIPLSAGEQVSRVLRGDGGEALHQVLELDGSRILLILAEVPANGSVRYALTNSEKGDKAAPDHPEKAPDYCYGRHVPERKDDYAWENDRMAFRIYGPALAATPGEVSGSGIDVWAKRVPYPVIDKWYGHGDYHRDHGEGLDAYSVRASRGCGGTGVFYDGKVYAAGVWGSQRTLATGPLRVVFEVSYPPYQAGSATITETKRVSLDRGSFFNKFRTALRIEGADSVQFAAGIVRRRNEEEPMQGPGWVSAMEPEAAHGRIGTALIMEGGGLLLADGHALLLRTVRDGETVEYMVGACWTKEGSFKDLPSWAGHTKGAAEANLKPLIVSYSN